MTYPTISPSLTLDFAKSKQLDPRIAFTRSSIGTYLDSDGLIKTAPSGVARFDYDNSGNALGLLVEESRTNLINYSTDFQNQWSNGSSATNNQTVSPDGTTTAAKFAAAWNKALIKTYTSTSISNTAIKFNLATGAYDSTIAGTPTDYDIESYGNGWYRCYFSVSNTTFSVFAKKGELDYIVIQLSNIKAFIYAWNAAGNQTTTTDGIYIWGAQIEAGDFPTSYIPTSGSTVTRAADVASMTGTNFSSWYNQGEGVLLTSINPHDVTNNDYAYSLSDGTSSERIVSLIGQSDSHYVVDGGSTQAQINYAGYTANTETKAAAAYATNDIAYATGGTVRGTDTSATIPTVDNLVIMANRSNGDHVTGTISRLSYYDRRVSNAALETLTS